MQDLPQVYIIAGCNGAGKTTASFTILPDIIPCREFVNADEIAKGLSPFQPESVAFEAGRIMLSRIHELLHQRANFAFETTLSTRSYHQFIKQAQQQGYVVTLLFFWLSSPELAIERVKTRVLEGGHDIPELIIRRRYQRGIYNLWRIFLPIVDHLLIFDNSSGVPDLMASKDIAGNLEIVQPTNFELLKQYI